MHHKRGGYSFLIRPILIIVDLLILIMSIYYILHETANDVLYFYLGAGWIFSSYILKFYEVYRFTNITKIISLLIKQSFLLILLLYAFYGFIKMRDVSVSETIRFISITIILVGVIKIISFYALKKYRSYLGGNNRLIIIIGNNEGTQQLGDFFKERIDLGYNVLGTFANDLPESIEDSFRFLKENDVDEIYCAVSELTNEQINEYVKYTDENYSILKFVPDSEFMFSKRIHIDHYDYIPILSIPEVSLNNSTNKYAKRFFDIVFSSLVILLVLSWLTPILYFLIKRESKGPLFYRHKRNGINYKEFECYKFRSMKYENHIELDQVTKGDARVTKIGQFIRRTSIDELPQFFNVFFGDMSVVGPRPHMISYTMDYAKKIDKYNYMFRHSVKPGITGLAQVKGYRGEVENNEDIINRIKYDIFYIENWTVLLDIKIIMETILNILKGDEKAY